MTTSLLHLSAQIERIELSADDKASGKKPQFAGVAYSGGAIPRRNWDGSAALINMDTFQLDETGREIFILADHNPSHKVGKATAYKRGGKVMIKNGEFFSNEHGQEAELLMSEGAPYEFSIGIMGDVTFYDSGNRKKKKVDNESVEIGTEIFNARLLETSLVTAGADPKTSVQRLSATFNLTPLEATMPETDNNQPGAAAQGTGQQAAAPAAPTPGTPTLAEFQTKNADLVTELTTAQISIRQLNNALKEKDEEIVKLTGLYTGIRNKRRDERLTDHFGDDITAAEREHFHSMDDKTFDLVMTKLSANKPTTVRRDGQLFAAHEAAKSGDKPGVSILMQSALNMGKIRQPAGAK